MEKWQNHLGVKYYLKKIYKNYYKFNPRVVKCWNDGKLLSDNNGTSLVLEGGEFLVTPRREVSSLNLLMTLYKMHNFYNLEIGKKKMRLRYSTD
jgi:hypothetical protein